MVLFSDTDAGLQYQVNLLKNYCQKWHFIVSLPKTRIMVFNKRKHTPCIYFSDQSLKTVSQYKNLGIIFDSNKTQVLQSTHTYLAEQANRAIFCSLKMYYGSMGKPTPSCMCKSFDAQMYSSSGIWL